ncbi:hypothetical protein IEQ34_010956 [Dendrobium chrysotoxum]|uniref:Uncharacterized protein n=1 Tax=Dendrobium chrysotoxum TaxID=161865 RepID=A0AAV7GX91_DENCH|nr:hypothetical protein IEQ34_010956 [Dendrobium chrysotoxum]
MYEVKGIIIEGNNYNVMRYVQGVMKNEDAKESCFKQEDFSFLRDFNQLPLGNPGHEAIKLALMKAVRDVQEKSLDDLKKMT